MWKKLATLIAGSVLVSSCQTVAYKPIICEPGTALKDGRCQKVQRIVKKPTPSRPRVAAARTPMPFVSPQTQPPRKSSDY